MNVTIERLTGEKKLRNGTTETVVLRMNRVLLDGSLIGYAGAKPGANVSLLMTRRQASEQLVNAIKRAMADHEYANDQSSYMDKWPRKITFLPEDPDERKQRKIDKKRYRRKVRRTAV